MAGKTVVVVRSLQDPDWIEVFDSRQSVSEEMSKLFDVLKDKWSKASLDYHLGRKDVDRKKDGKATYKGYRVYERRIRMSDKKRKSRQELSKRRKGKYIGE